MNFSSVRLNRLKTFLLSKADSNEPGKTKETTPYLRPMWPKKMSTILFHDHPCFLFWGKMICCVVSSERLKNERNKSANAQISIDRILFLAASHIFQTYSRPSHLHLTTHSLSTSHTPYTSNSHEVFVII